MASQRLARKARPLNAFDRLTGPLGCTLFVGFTGASLWVLLQFIRLVVHFIVLVEGL